MRSAFAAFAAALTMLAASAAPLAAAQGHGEGPVDLLSPNYGLMVWTLAIFVVLLVVLARFAFKPLIAAVAAREESLRQLLDGAKRDREEAQRLLDEQRKALDLSRGEAQRIIADARVTGERLRNDMLEQTKHQQQELLDRARVDIENEKRRAIADLRREAVDLALAGASKVIERNLDDQTNRKLVEGFLSTVPVATARR